MAKDNILYLGHMLDQAVRIKSKIAGLSRSDFDADDNLKLALAHLIQTIGEAARLVSADFKSAHPEIAWQQITGMRHRIVHDYLDVNFNVVWVVATEHLDQLIEQLTPMVPPLPPE